jgi:hypothetical protein
MHGIDVAAAEQLRQLFHVEGIVFTSLLGDQPITPRLPQPSSQAVT